MKKTLEIFILIFLVNIISACGGGGGGGGKGSGSISPGVFEKEFVNTESYGTCAYPFGESYDMKTQFLYLSSEINGSGRITKIRLYQYSAEFTAVTCFNMTIKMGHTALSSLTTAFAYNAGTDKGAEVTVFSNATISIPAGLGGTWIDIHLSTPFEYNGVDNLVIDFETTTGCSDDVQIAVYTGSAGRCAHSYASNTQDGVAEFSSTTGTLYDLQPYMQFVFEGGENKAGFDPNYGYGFSAPFTTSTIAQKAQILYEAASIKGSGLISGLGIQINEDTSAVKTYTYTMKLMNYPKDSMDLTWETNLSAGNPVTVAKSVQFTVPAGLSEGDFIWLPMPDGGFVYNGSDNLLIEISVESADAELQLAARGGYSSCILCGSAEGAWFSSAYPIQISLRFYGATMDVITDGGGSSSYAFNTASNGKLNLYRPVELGTAGTIESIYCRLESDASTAAAYSNYRVIIGHCGLDQLSTSANDNFTSQISAVSGTVSVPAGLVKGDWIEIPLSKTFDYDGKSNLAVWLGTTGDSGAGVIHNCTVSSADGTLYEAQSSIGAPGSSTVTTQDSKFDMKFKIAK